MDVDSFIFFAKTDDIAEDVEKRFDTSNYEVDRLLSMGKNEKVLGVMKDELGEQIMKEFVWLRAKIYSHLKGSNDECKKAKETKKCVVKRKLKFKDYKKMLKGIQNFKYNKLFRKERN